MTPYSVYVLFLTQAGLSGAAEKKTKERVGEALSGGNVWSRAMER